MGFLFKNVCYALETEARAAFLSDINGMVSYSPGSGWYISYMTDTGSQSNFTFCAYPSTGGSPSCGTWPLYYPAFGSCSSPSEWNQAYASVPAAASSAAAPSSSPSGSQNITVDQTMELFGAVLGFLIVVAVTAKLKNLFWRSHDPV